MIARQINGGDKEALKVVSGPPLGEIDVLRTHEALVKDGIHVKVTDRSALLHLNGELHELGKGVGCDPREAWVAGDWGPGAVHHGLRRGHKSKQVEVKHLEEKTP